MLFFESKVVTNGGGGFRTYGYDGNGNATSDGLGNTINYNLLNLPATIPGKNLTYVYDASGNKLRKVSSGNTTDYIDGIVYESGSLSFLQNEEGRVLNLTGTPNYEYSLNDHLGNSRVTFDSNGGAVAKQTDDYYPFGLVAYQPSTPSPENKYLYNGKEIQRDLNDQYDYGARFYDPIIGRWTTIDPLAELGRRWSPYTYALNNPIRYIDPDGMWAENYEDSDVALLPDSRYYEPLSTGETDVNYIPKKQDDPKPEKPKPKPSVEPGSAAALVISLNEVTVSATAATKAVPFVAWGFAGWTAGWQIGTHMEGFTNSVASFLVKVGVPASALYPPIVHAAEKTADELLPGSLKRSPSYNPKYGNKTRKELSDLAKKGDQIAKKMKKLMDQIPRLLDKNRSK